MIGDPLSLDVQGTTITVTMPGTRYSASYRKTRPIRSRADADLDPAMRRRQRWSIFVPELFRLPSLKRVSWAGSSERLKSTAPALPSLSRAPTSQ